MESLQLFLCPERIECSVTADWQCKGHNIKKRPSLVCKQSRKVNNDIVLLGKLDSFSKDVWEIY
jgi:hypothetical protein